MHTGEYVKTFYQTTGSFTIYLPGHFIPTSHFLGWITNFSVDQFIMTPI